MTNRASTRCRLPFFSIIFLLYIRSLCIYYVDRLDGAIDIARIRRCIHIAMYDAVILYDTTQYYSTYCC